VAAVLPSRQIDVATPWGRFVGRIDVVCRRLREPDPSPYAMELTRVRSEYEVGTDFTMEFRPSALCGNARIGFIQICLPTMTHHGGRMEFWPGQSAAPKIQDPVTKWFLDNENELSPFYKSRKGRSSRLADCRFVVDGEGVGARDGGFRWRSAWMGDRPRRKFGVSHEAFAHEFETVAIAITDDTDASRPAAARVRAGQVLGVLRWAYGVMRFGHNALDFEVTAVAQRHPTRQFKTIAVLSSGNARVVIPSVAAMPVMEDHAAARVAPPPPPPPVPPRPPAADVHAVVAAERAGTLRPPRPRPPSNNG
jgi:hypothetical protein